MGTSWDQIMVARNADSYISQEGALPLLRSAFNSYRDFWEVYATSFGLQSLAQKTPNCCEGWERQTFQPNFGDLVQLSIGVQEAAVQGEAAGRMGAGPTTWAGNRSTATLYDLQYWFADIITNREDDWQEVMDAMARGDIPLTQTEQDAQALANTWKDMVTSGNADDRAAALAAAGITQTGDRTIDYEFKLEQNVMDHIKSDSVAEFKTQFGVVPTLGPKNANTIERLMVVGAVAFTMGTVYHSFIQPKLLK